jgi:hypothetical protein
MKRLLILTLCLIGISGVSAQKKQPQQPANPRVAPARPQPPQKPVPPPRTVTPATQKIFPDTNAADLRNDSLAAYSAPASDFRTHTLHKGNHALVSAGLVLGFTQGGFREVSNSDVGVGLGLTIMGNLMGTDDDDKSPVNVYVGGTFEYLYFGGESGSVEYSDPYPYDAINNKVTTSVNNNVYSLLLNTRVEFLNGPFVPFIEGAAGGRWFDGKQKVVIDRTQRSGSTLPSGITFQPTSESFGDNLETDFTAAYGYGGGIRFGRGPVRLELKLMYMYGTTARYIDNQSIRIDPGTRQISYSTIISHTDMLLPQISISLDL